jgi:hypothetical protein
MQRVGKESGRTSPGRGCPPPEGYVIVCAAEYTSAGAERAGANVRDAGKLGEKR